MKAKALTCGRTPLLAIPPTRVQVSGIFPGLLPCPHSPVPCLGPGPSSPSPLVGTMASPVLQTLNQASHGATLLLQLPVAKSRAPLRPPGPTPASRVQTGQLAARGAGRGHCRHAASAPASVHAGLGPVCHLLLPPRPASRWLLLLGSRRLHFSLE